MHEVYITVLYNGYGPLPPPGSGRPKVQKEVKDMEKNVRSYETLFVISGNLQEEEVKALTEKFTALVSANGELESVDEWGKRRLAYPINYINEGYYVLVNYKSDASFPQEFERVLGITDGIIRSMTTIRSEAAIKAAAKAEPEATVSAEAEVKVAETVSEVEKTAEE